MKKMLSVLFVVMVSTFFSSCKQEEILVADDPAIQEIINLDQSAFTEANGSEKDGGQKTED